MTFKERDQTFGGLFDACRHTTNAKGAAYSGTEDALANFKRLADRLGLTPFQVWAVYFTKHIDAILNAIRKEPGDPVEATEGMHGRIIDGINYLGLLECLLMDHIDSQAREAIEGTVGALAARAVTAPLPMAAGYVGEIPPAGNA